ncbi:family A G protein-coupled receptor-like protein [Aspergillus campestris IBT 28561]|uniref:Family A G protein-coupled receptor-like protein n=1 Tax=Aspergillus campestris (strain IBT 28561) TaxID=1392248 RepID=A0A2I1CU96_ASPC2|nr:family A G protein-coupled receptor-like protein [Aspergillus campestris IBT 28561]PKY01200.1 family A G protein-coupled receptor-like protein [Aspergillus campestris IBT 28561]
MSLVQLSSVLGPHHDEGHSLLPRLAYTKGGSTGNIDPLPSAHRNGLIAVFIMAILSFIATLVLISFITYRLVFWRSNYRRYIGYNQYIVLIYNLVLADLQQSLAFLICLKWIVSDKIEASSTACFLQGFWLQIGDPSSGLFVLAIAIHTFFLVTMGRKISHRMFVISVVSTWVFVAILVIIPIGLYGRSVFIPSGAWCWINEEYEPIRLWTHYLWIFLAEFGTVCLYAVMWFQLRRRIQQSAILGHSHTESLKRLRRVIGYMVIYPIAYIVLSLPLAAGRMATAQGKTPSLVYFCIAGALITSSGLVDVLLYTLTRRNLILESEPSDDRSYNQFPSTRTRKTDHFATFTADPSYNRTEISALRTVRGEELDDTGMRDGSTDGIVQPSSIEMTPMGKVYQHTTIEITSEPAYPSEGEHVSQSSRDSPGAAAGHEPPFRIWRK